MILCTELRNWGLLVLKVYLVLTGVMLLLKLKLEMILVLLFGVMLLLRIVDLGLAFILVDSFIFYLDKPFFLFYVTDFATSKNKRYSSSFLNLS